MAQTIQFGILGSLDVRAGNERLTFGPKVAAVLARLLLAEGQPVSAEALIDGVWGEAPPPTARASLQMHVSRIRTVLAPRGMAGALATEGSSYRLRLEPDQLDLTIFRRLVEAGRMQLGGGEAHRARELLSDARDLWRGSPLADVELPGAAPGALGELEALREQASVLLVEAELELGHHTEALPGLRRLRVERPLDEHVASLAALAHHRSGRQADALGELATLRRDLAEQLGMQPGPAITELERRILAGDPDLVPAPPTAPVRHELRKTVTVVTLRLAPGDLEEVRAATAALGELFDRVVRELGGWCPPPGSGRLVGVFGVPAAHEDDAQRALLAADAARRAAGSIGGGARVGVATGEVLVEVAGNDVRMLTHDPVEVADQLARAARGGEVVLGVGTARLAQAIAELDPEPLLVLADDEAPIVAHRLARVGGVPPSRRLSSVLVGREPELDRLRDGATRALTEARPTLLSVLGDAGVGKSRLAAELVASLGDRVEAAWGRCLPYGRDIGMWPVAEVIRAVAGIAPGGGAGAARRRLRRFIAEEAGALAEQLEAAIGLAERSPAPDETSWAIRRFLEIAARRRPLVVVIEDLHWADDSLLDLLGYVTSTASRAPLAIVATARPELLERRPSWGIGGADAQVIRVEPLDAQQSNVLLTRLLGASKLEGPARERLASLAEGNPLYLEEMVWALIDDGHLRASGGRWEPAGDLGAVPLPPTVTALLEARLDRLGVTERDVVEAAAIAGREFGDEDLEDLRPDAPAVEVAGALEALTRRGLLELRRFSGPGTRAWAFRHGLVRDVCYHQIPMRVRARGHERLGRGLADRAGERLAEIQEIVGYHLETALELARALGGSAESLGGLSELAATHLGAAGRRAFVRDDLGAAASLLGRAIAAADPASPERGELARLRGGALFDLGSFAEAEEALATGAAAAEQIDDDALRWRLGLERMHVQTYLRPDGKVGFEAEAYAHAAIEALGELGDLAGLARAHRLRAEALLLQGRQEEANEAFLTGHRLALTSGDERELTMHLHLTGLHGPMPLGAFIAQCERALAESARRRPETLMRLGLALALRGEQEQAHRRIDEGLAVARDVGGAFRVADAEVHAGAALLYLGEAVAAARHLQRAVDGLKAIGERSVRATALALLAETWFRLGRLEEADALAGQCLAIASDDDQAAQMAWRQVRAKVLAARGEAGPARRLAAEASAIADDTDFVTMAAFAHLDRAEVEARAGDAQIARQERDRAFELLRRKGVSEQIVSPAAAVGP